MSDGSGAGRVPFPRPSIFGRKNTTYSGGTGSCTSVGTFDVPDFDIYGDLLDLDNMTKEQYRSLFKPGFCRADVKNCIFIPMTQMRSIMLPTERIISTGGFSWKIFYWKKVQAFKVP